MNPHHPHCAGESTQRVDRRTTLKYLGLGLLLPALAPTDIRAAVPMNAPTPSPQGVGDWVRRLNEHHAARVSRARAQMIVEGEILSGEISPLLVGLVSAELAAELHEVPEDVQRTPELQSLMRDRCAEIGRALLQSAERVQGVLGNSETIEADTYRSFRSTLIGLRERRGGRGWGANSRRALRELEATSGPLSLSRCFRRALRHTQDLLIRARRLGAAHHPAARSAIEDRAHSPTGVESRKSPSEGGATKAPDDDLNALIGVLAMGGLMVSGVVVFTIGAWFGAFSSSLGTTLLMVGGVVLALLGLFIGVRAISRALDGSPATPHRRAETAPSHSDSTPRIEVSAQGGWSPTAVWLDVGTPLRCDSVGETRDAAGRVYPPEGVDTEAGPGAPFPIGPKGALVGRVHGGVFVLGQDTTLSAQLSGPLDLAVNIPEHERGEWSGSLRVNIRPSPAPQSPIPQLDPDYFRDQ